MIFPAVLILVLPAQAGKLGNWVRPDGFAAPSLNAGQYSFRAGIGLAGHEYKWQESEERLSYEGEWEGRKTRDVWRVVSSVTYGLTDRLVLLAGVTYRPGQKYNDEGSDEEWDNDPYSYHFREDLKHSISSRFVLAYRLRPLTEIVFSGSVYSSKFEQSIRHLETNPGSEDGWDQNRNYDLFVGINIAR